MKYYFIYYSCYRTNWPANFPVNSNTTFNQDITDTHPLTWQIKCNENYDKRMPIGEGFYSENYKVISWQVLTLDEFNTYKGLIG